MTGAADSDDVVRMMIDDTVCIGGGLCEMSEEETFLLDDDTVTASVQGDGLLPRERALLVADRCPGRAISFVEVDGGSDAS